MVPLLLLLLLLPLLRFLMQFLLQHFGASRVLGSLHTPQPQLCQHGLRHQQRRLQQLLHGQPQPQRQQRARAQVLREL
jgi:hypothetical protein